MAAVAAVEIAGLLRGEREAALGDAAKREVTVRIGHHTWNRGVASAAAEVDAARSERHRAHRARLTAATDRATDGHDGGADRLAGAGIDDLADDHAGASRIDRQGDAADARQDGTRAGNAAACARDDDFDRLLLYLDLRRQRGDGERGGDESDREKTTREGRAGLHRASLWDLPQLDRRWIVAGGRETGRKC